MAPRVGGAEEVEMEPRIWAQLPDELLERILALLPLRALLALRPTCRRFRSLLFSPSFLCLLTADHLPSVLLLSHPQFSPRLLPFYDSSSSSSSWRSLPLPPSSLLLSSSANGLLLLLLPSSRLLLSNPLTRSSLLLPLPVRPVFSATLLSLPSSSSSPRSYNIFLPDPSSNRAFLYDSLSASWACLPARPTSPSDGVLFRSALHFTTPDPISVVSLDLRSASWDTSPAPPLPAGLVFARLVGDGGDRLFLVGGLGGDGISRSVSVWELSGGAWREAARLPELMRRKFVSVCYHNYAHVYCLWHDGTVCVCCTTWPEVLFYRVARGTWHWLPRCPWLQEKWSCGFRWFSFMPDLNALV